MMAQIKMKKIYTYSWQTSLLLVIILYLCSKRYVNSYVLMFVMSIISYAVFILCFFSLFVFNFSISIFFLHVIKE